MCGPAAPRPVPLGQGARCPRHTVTAMPSPPPPPRADPTSASTTATPSRTPTRGCATSTTPRCSRTSRPRTPTRRRAPSTSRRCGSAIFEEIRVARQGDRPVGARRERAVVVLRAHRSRARSTPRTCRAPLSATRRRAPTPRRMPSPASRSCRRQRRGGGQRVLLPRRPHRQRRPPARRVRRRHRGRRALRPDGSATSTPATSLDTSITEHRLRRASFSRDGPPVFYTRLDEAWRPHQLWRHRGRATPAERRARPPGGRRALLDGCRQLAATSAGSCSGSAPRPPRRCTCSTPPTRPGSSASWPPAARVSSTTSSPPRTASSSCTTPTTPTPTSRGRRSTARRTSSGCPC